MKKIYAALLSAMLCVAMVFAAACGGGENGDKPKPQKLKDGTAITLTEGDRHNINLSDYISLPEGYVYAVSSSAEAVATVSLSGSAATVNAVKKGSAKITASAGEVFVEFAVTVNEKTVTPVEKPAPVFEDLKLEYDLKDEASKTLTLAPQSGDESYVYSYALKEADENVTIVKDKLTAAYAAVTEKTLTVTVTYTDSEKPEAEAKTVEFNITVKVTDTRGSEENPNPEVKPVLKQEAVETSIDIYELEADEKEGVTLNFAENVEAPADVELNYEVTLNGAPVTLDGDNCAVYNFEGNFTETATNVTFAVTVKYGQNNSSVSYNYTLHITDTTAYRITNGTFDDGLNGWTLSNAKLGSVTADTHYWLNDEENADGYPFGNDGKFFSAYAQGASEGAMGTLTSLPFKIGGSGYITYQLGGAKNVDKVYLDVIEKDTGAILARYGNSLWQERTEGVKSGCSLIFYKADLSAHKGKTVYIRITDVGESDYGLFFADSFVTYYKAVPEVLNTAEEKEHPANIRTGDEVSKYQVYNGGFESGLEGWTCVDGAIPGAVSSANRYWGADYGNTGKLFTAVEGHGEDTPHDPNLEYRMGTIRSEKFTLKANAWISFRLGGSNYDTLGIRIVKTDGTVIACFQNTNVSAAGEGQLVQYKYHFDNAEEIECYIEIFDNEPNGAGERPWRLVVVDEIITDLEAEPAEGLAATNQIS
ncbi:MAG: hypothetical protein K2I20_05505 [Clostridia bacterium]|nr:hypothetical protein [Clostridia bacterium]